MKHYNIPIFIPHLGCPFNCIFCNQKRIASLVPAPDPDLVLDMVQSALKSLPVLSQGREIEVAYYGGSFTALDQDLQEKYLLALQSCLKQGAIEGIRLSTRPDFIDPSVLDLLGRHGVSTIELGIQSFNEEVLAASGRGYSSQIAVDACRLIKEFGFRLGIQLMIGLPGDSFENDMETTFKTIELEPDLVRIYPTLVIKNTPLADMYEAGHYQPLKLHKAVAVCARMFMHFQQQNIKVIRMGLHPSEELREEGVILAGPFHPAFGELVEQLVFQKQAQALLNDYISAQTGIRNLIIYSNHRDLSKVLGYKRGNLHYLQGLCGLGSLQGVKVHPDLKPNELGIGPASSAHPDMTLSRLAFLSTYLQ